MALGPESAAPLAIQTLGAFRVLRDGEAVPATAWQSKKARDALKLLVAQRGRPVARSMLIEALWPDEDPAKTPGRLSVALSRIRGVLDPDHRFGPGELLVSADDTIALDLREIAVDVVAFLAQAQSGLALLAAGKSEEAQELLEAAEAFYTGAFLEENAYDDWALPLREEARAAYTSTTTALADLAASSGNHDAAIRYRLRVLELDPYDEPAHLGLVAAFGDAGRHGEARRAYRTYVDRMGRIGVEPAPFAASTPSAETT
jgi:DNA-binding SARP family transcriptional activator